MSRAGLVLAGVALPLGGCGGCGNDSVTYDGGLIDSGPMFTDCSGDAASFVRQSFLALTGRRPKSQAEVDVYVDLYNQTVAKNGEPKAAVANAIMAEPEFRERWVDTFMDALRVQRIDFQTEATCWDKPLRATVTTALATAVRDQNATGAGDGSQWTMLDLARSAIELDDVTPLYRAQIFSMVAHPIPAANASDINAELSRRADFGATFDAGFLHRNTVCLDCHNSFTSRTDSDDPALDRHWPVPGLPEMAVYGAFMGIDPDVAHTAFRVDSFVEPFNGSRRRPWGWTTDNSTTRCGEFAVSVPDDVAGVNGHFASVTGQRTTVFELEAAMKRGFDHLRGTTPAFDGMGMIEDPDTALAWLITLKITEDVWTKVTGTHLTIANYFPRNQASSDLLYALAKTYTQSGYSLKALLTAIVSSPYFNRKPAELACGAGPYTYPNVYDPWVTSDSDPAKRLNGPGDAVTAVDPRTLMTALSGALDWAAPPHASKFPDYGDTGCETETCPQRQSQCQSFGTCCKQYAATCNGAGGIDALIEVAFERGIGVFLRNSEPGFRGLDFQARLVWEQHVAQCARPPWVASDFIDKLVAAGAASSTATNADLVAALKDRLVNEPAIAAGAETDALVAIMGPLDSLVGPLDATAQLAKAAQLRQVCGALVTAPQFLMQGIAGRGGDRPALTPMEAGYAAVCAEVASHVTGASCATGSLALP